MRDTVSLIGKLVTINEIEYLVKDFCYLPVNEKLYVKMVNPKKKKHTINFPYSDLLEFLKTQTRSCRIR